MLYEYHALLALESSRLGAAGFEMDTEREAYVQSLSKFTYLSAWVPLGFFGVTVTAGPYVVSKSVLLTQYSGASQTG